jgi:hypothetical protein
MSTPLDIPLEADRLAVLDPDVVYERELARWLEPDRRDTLATFIAAVIASEARPITPSLEWPVDLIAHVPEHDLPVVTAAARHAEKNPRIGKPPRGSKRIDDVFHQMLYADHLPANVLEVVARHAPAVKASSAKPGRRRRVTPEPLCPPHHLSLSLADRCRTAREPFERFARRHHPTWALDDAANAIPVLFGGVRDDARAAASTIAVLRIEDLAALVPGSTFGAIDIDLPADLLFDLTRAHAAHDERGRLRSLALDDGRDASDQCDRALVRCEARLVPTPARFVHQDWAGANRRENLNRFGGEPTFIQGPEYPTCPSCSEVMRFLMQLELGLPCVDDTNLEESGIDYAFLCTACRVTSWIKQYA